MADFEQVDDKAREASDKIRRRIRITKADLVKYGYTDGCPRCSDLRGGAKDSTHNHTEDCRFRVYGEWEAHNDPKWILLGNISRANTLKMTSKKAKSMPKGIKGFLKLLLGNHGRLKSDRQLLIMSP